MSTVQQTAINLLKQGIICIPILANQKVPPKSMVGWNNLTDADIPKLISAWQKLKNPEYNVAVLTGRLVCYDFDIYKSPQHEEYFNSIKESLPETYTERSASGGYHYFYYSPTPLASRVADGQFDFKAAGGYVLIAPSTFQNAEYHQISTIPLSTHLPLPPELYKTPETHTILTTTRDLLTTDDILDMLRYISAEERSTWVTVGMALKSYELQKSTSYFNIFHNWSKNAKSYKSEDDCKKTYNSFNRTSTDTVTIATLIKIAKDNGYPKDHFDTQTNFNLANHYFTVEQPSEQSAAQLINDPESLSLTPTIEGRLRIIMSSSTVTRSRSEQIKALQLPDDFFFNCPSPIGRLTKELCDLARNPMPSITFATLLATTGYLKAGQYKTSDRDNAWHPTNYIACFAPTSSGKGFAQSIILEILQKFNKTSGIVDSFKSVPAMVGTLNNAPNHNVFQQLDESSSFFKLPNEHTPHYLADLLPELTKIWSKADEIYISSGTKKEKFKDRAEIQGPKLNILNFSQPQALYSIAGSTLVSSGLIPRFLIIVDERLEYSEKQGKIRPPQNLINYLEKYALNGLNTAIEDSSEEMALHMANKAMNTPMAHSEAVKGGKELQSDTIGEDNLTGYEVTHSMKIVEMSDEARDIYQRFEKRIFNERKQFQLTANPMSDMLGKAAELAGRVAITLVDGQTIEADLMRWCCKFVENSLQISMIAIGDIIIEQKYRKFSEFEEDLLQALSKMQKENKYKPVRVLKLKESMRRKITNIGGYKSFKEILNNLNDSKQIKLITTKSKSGQIVNLISIWSELLDEA
jgi:hypothetical protein